MAQVGVASPSPSPEEPQANLLSESKGLSSSVSSNPDSPPSPNTPTAAAAVPETPAALAAPFPFNRPSSASIIPLAVLDGSSPRPRLSAAPVPEGSLRPLEEILESVDSGPVGELELSELRRLTASARRSEARKTFAESKQPNITLTKSNHAPNRFECRTSRETLYFQVLNAPQNPTTVTIFMHGVDESLDTPGCAKLAEVWAAKGHVLVGIELHRHGRSSYDHGPRATLPPAEVMVSELEELIMLLRSTLLPQQVRLLPFALAGHSLGGALAILLSHRFIRTAPERFLGCILFAPAVDTLVDASWNCCGSGCCCPPTFTHCCSLAHPFFACFASCFTRPCCSCCLPMDDPSTGNSGYLEEREAYRSSPHNHIARFHPASLKTLLELMRTIQTSHWPLPPLDPPAIPFCMLFGDKDSSVPPRSMRSFARAHAMRELSPAPEDVKKSSVYICLEKGNHQILGYRRKADGSDEIRQDVLPLMAAWLEARSNRS